METWLIWALVLFLAGLIVTLAEVVLPSGGLLAAVAVLCLLGSLACAYQLSGWIAVALLLVEGVCVPAVIILAFKFLPKTSVGKNLLLEPPPDESAGTTAPETPPPWTVNEYAGLLHKEGVVVAQLRPSGTAEIDGRRLSVISDGQLIPQGSRIRVIRVEGNRIVVEPVGA
ncbi:MAG TPA: NfeD family protein [Phycisphaerae bacterium]|nr:NfeD family protein [Phycisphaerae bacterium]